MKLHLRAGISENVQPLLDLSCPHTLYTHLSRLPHVAAAVCPRLTFTPARAPTIPYSDPARRIKIVRALNIGMACMEPSHLPSCSCTEGCRSDVHQQPQSLPSHAVAPLAVA